MPTELLTDVPETWKVMTTEAAGRTFDTMADDQRDQLLQGGSWMRLTPSERFPLELSRDPWMIVRGFMALGFQDDNDRIRSPRGFRPGSVLWEKQRLVDFNREKQPVIEDRTLVIPIIPTLAYRIPAENYERFRDDRAFLLGAARRFAEADSASLGFLYAHTATEKDILLARVLVFLGNQFGEPVMERLMLRIRQEDLAHFACLTRRYVNICLGRWADKGWLETGKGWICFTEPGPLIEMSGWSITRLEGDPDGGRRLD